MKLNYSRALCDNRKSRISENSQSKIPFWDGKAPSFGVYISMIKACINFVGIGGCIGSCFDRELSNLV